MTSNDKQIDVLMQRYAKAAPQTNITGHLDADELSAFAEGALPPATRSRYVSHLADCNECRKQASALVISSGVVVRAEESPSKVNEGRTFWQALVGMFALPVLRYAAFAAVVLIIAGVAFVALRRPRTDSESKLIAASEPEKQQAGAAVKPPTSVQDGGLTNKQANSETRSASPSQLGPGNERAEKPEALRAAEDAPANPLTKPMKEAAPAAPVDAEKKVEVAQAAPSYAPVPPGEATTQQKQEAYRGQQRVAGISGPRQQQKVDSYDKLAQEREREATKDAARTDDVARKSAPASVASNQAPPSPRRAADEKAKGPMRNMESNTINRSENAGRAEASKTTNSAGADRASTEEAPQTRSAAGKKFRRQGVAWVDQKFKSSMTLINVSRGSDEFASLDSGLRSIAQQLGGEVIVVWKGKAYLIK